MKKTLWDDVKKSVYNYVDHLLMENAAYINVTTGLSDSRSNDLSTFYPVIDTQIYNASGYVWQSAFHNFVYESSVSNQPPPIVISGIYLNNSFLPTGNSYDIDFDNGRVIFRTPQSTASSVRANFSYKEYTFRRPDAREPYENKTKYSENSPVYSAPFAATPYTVHFPAMIFEIENGSEEGFQFGGGMNQSFPSLSITLLSDDKDQIEGIASILLGMAHKGIPIVSATEGPKFNYFNNLTEPYSFVEWTAKARNHAFVKSVNYNKIYHSNRDSSQPELFAGRVKIEISAIR